MRVPDANVMGPGGVIGGSGEPAYIASRRLRSPHDEVVLELRESDAGVLSVLAFTSLEALVQCCGNAQPWVAVPMELIDQLVRRSGAEGVLWDAALAPEQQHGAEEG
jgi:hypothetical protein